MLCQLCLVMIVVDLHSTEYSLQSEPAHIARPHHHLFTHTAYSSSYSPHHGDHDLNPSSQPLLHLHPLLPHLPPQCPNASLTLRELTPHPTPPHRLQLRRPARPHDSLHRQIRRFHRARPQARPRRAQRVPRPDRRIRR